MPRIFKTLFITFIALLGLKAQGLTLVIWVDDGKVTTEEAYNAAIAELHTAAPDEEIQTVYTSKRAAKESIKDLVAQHGLKGPISNILIGTHGGSMGWPNRTWLMGLGGLSPTGTFGHLKSIFAQLGEAHLLAPDLHIYLNACATACGGDQRFSERVQGLYMELKAYGVKTLSLWGAQKSMRANQYRADSFWQIMVKLQKKMAPYFAAILAPSVLAIGATSLFFASDPDILERVVRAVKLFAYTMGTIYVYVNAYEVFGYFTGGTKGYFIQIKDQDVKLNTIDLSDPRAVVGERCEGQLAPL